LASVLGASVPAWIVGFALDTATPLYGATPLLYGGIAAMCWLDLSRPVSLFGALTMTAQQLLLLLVGIAVLMFLFDKNVNHLVGELGALGGGILYARWLRRPRTPRKPPPSRRPPRSGGFKVIKGGQDEKGLLH
jgi:membrane associated rhomboid family serine protease